MKNDQELNNQAFVEKLRRSLEQESDTLDAVTAARLQAIRQTVLKQSDKSSGLLIQHPARWVLGSSFATAVLVISLVALNMNSHHMNSQPDLNIMDDLNILSQQETLDFYENMEFYQWLDETENNG